MSLVFFRILSMAYLSYGLHGRNKRYQEIGNYEINCI